MSGNVQSAAASASEPALSPSATEPEVSALSGNGQAQVEAALLAVLDAVRDYLPPDGISAHDCLTRVIGAVDNPTINPLIRAMERAL